MDNFMNISGNHSFNMFWISKFNITESKMDWDMTWYHPILKPNGYEQNPAVYFRVWKRIYVSDMMYIYIYIQLFIIIVIIIISIL